MWSASAKMRCPWKNAAAVPDERVGYAALKDFSRQIAPVLATQGALDRNPRGTQCFHHRGYILAASLATDHDVAPALRTFEHESR